MTNEIVVRTAQDLAEKMDWSKAMAGGSLIPAQYRNNPANLLFAIEYADALGIERINAITEIFVIDGKPSASANLIAGLVRKAGHILRVEGDDTYATATLIRSNDPDHPSVATWTMDKARQAGLAGKNVWKAYPGAMLRSRAITEVARMGATDATLGLVYTAEELGAEVDAQGKPIKESGFTSAVVTGSGADRMKNVLHLVGEVITDSQDAEIVELPTEPTADKVTAEQMNTIGALMGKLGMSEPAIQLAYAGDCVEHPITSPSELSGHEAARLITYLLKDVDQAALAEEAKDDGVEE